MACRRLEVLLVNFAHGTTQAPAQLPIPTSSPFLRSLYSSHSPIDWTLIFSRVFIRHSIAAASAYNHTLEPLDKKISKYLDGNPIRVDGKPRASGVLDTVRFFFFLLLISPSSLLYPCVRTHIDTLTDTMHRSAHPWHTESKSHQSSRRELSWSLLRVYLSSQSCLSLFANPMSYGNPSIPGQLLNFLVLWRTSVWH